MKNKEEFNLSEKNLIVDFNGLTRVYPEEDVKEFIKRVKEEIRARDIPVSGIIEELDKLAGEKLK